MAFAGWGTFFAAVGGPLVKKVLTALGFGVVTLVGLQAVKGQIDSAVGAAWTGLPADTYQVLALGGWVDALSYWLAAIATAVAFLAVGRIAQVSA